MSTKIRVGILFGGRSGEHEVSLLSAASILKAIDRERYEIVPVGITKEGRWVTSGAADALLSGAALPALEKDASPKTAGRDLQPTALGQTLKVDVIFPVLHGTFGEDGTIQGLFEMADVAYVGSGVLGSAAAMDKDIMNGFLGPLGCPRRSTSVFCAATGGRRPGRS